MPTSSMLRTLLTPKPLTGTQAKKIGGANKISTRDQSLLLSVGTATPGTNKNVRAADRHATSILSQPGRFAHIPSSGGFTVLGKNRLGQEIARDNTTGHVRPVSAFGPISATARSIGEFGGGRVESKKDDTRRRSGQRGAGEVIGSTLKKKKNILGTEETLGAASILG